MTSPYLDRPEIPAPPLPFEVMDVMDDGKRYIFVRRRDGKHYRPFEPMGINPETYRGECEWLCDVLNEVHDYAAREQIKRTRAADQASAAFVGGMGDLDLTRTIPQAAAVFVGGEYERVA